MKIGELVKLTGVSKPLIHHYIREGLVRKPKMIGKNAADYDEDHVEQILMIKDLRDGYFLPLPIIKKIIKSQKKQPGPERFALRLQNEYFKPVDRFFPHDIHGTEEFCRATGLGRFWLKQMEEWEIISPKMIDGEKVYSQQDELLGRLVVEMDELGFGPKDGYEPEFLKMVADVLREILARSIKNHLAENLEKLGSDEYRDTHIQYSEVLSLFVYYLFRKIIKVETIKFCQSREKTENEGDE